MKAFLDQRFLIKIRPEEFSYIISRKDNEYAFITPTFKFFSSQKEGYKISEETGVVRLVVGDISLKGFELVWDPKQKTISVRTDLFSLYPLMFMPSSDGGLWISNTSFYFPLVEPRYKLDSAAANQFFSSGFLLPGQFFVCGVQRISGPWQWTFGKKANEISRCVWTSELLKSTSFSELNFFNTSETLQRALSDILRLTETCDFRMSGGADSRIISLLLPSELKNKIRIKIVRCEWMNPDQDLDYQVAKRWCEKNGWEYEVLVADARHSAIFDGSEDTPLLSGLYGGEFLGGAWRKIMPSQLTEPNYQFCLSIEGQENLEYQTSKILKKKPFEQLLLSKQVLTHSDRSILCGNVRTGWSSPQANQRTTISPFAVAPFLQHILVQSEESLLDYNYLSKYLEHIEGANLFPLCSQITSLFPRWTAPTEWGEEPKQYRPNKPPAELTAENFYEEIFHVLLSRGLTVDPERFFANTKLRPFKLLCRSFYYAFPSEFKTGLETPVSLLTT